MKLTKILRIDGFSNIFMVLVQKKIDELMDEVLQLKSQLALAEAHMQTTTTFQNGVAVSALENNTDQHKDMVIAQKDDKIAELVNDGCRS